MLHAYEFEIYPEEEGWYLAEAYDFDAMTQGRTFNEAVLMASDLLRLNMEYMDIHGEPFPKPTYCNEPKHGGKVICIAVDAGKDTIRKVTASEAARMLGVTPGRVTQMIDANLLEAWREGHRTWVTVDSVNARLAEKPHAGRPKKKGKEERAARAGA